MLVETIKHTDVRGKTLLYLKISNEKGEVLMNIGEKSFNQIEILKNGERTLNEVDNTQNSNNGGGGNTEPATDKRGVKK